MYSVVNKVLERAGSPRSHASTDLDALEERLLRRLDRQMPPAAPAPPMGGMSDMERRLEARMERVMQMVSDLQSQNLARANNGPPPIMSVSGSKDPGEVNSSVVPSASPTASPARQPWARLRVVVMA
jgi:hypothetical protein